MVKLYLQMFAEGGGDGGAGSGLSAAPAQAAPAQQQHPGEIAAAAALQEFQQKKAAKLKGRVNTQPVTAPQPERTASAAQQQATAPQQAPQPEAAQVDKSQAFEDLVKGEYKDEFQKRMSTAIQDRLKNSKGAEEALAKLNPALDALYTQRGVEKGNIEALVKSITDDDSLYEDEALQKGIPVETLKQMKHLEQETASLKQQAEQLKAQEQQTMQRKIFERHIQGLAEQGNALKQLYPNFDLQAELKNEQFAKLTSPGVNIDVRTAYEVVHRDQLQPAMAAAIANRTAMDMSRSIQSASMRPQENGLAASNPLSLSDNPANWSKSRLKEIANRVKAGERITF